MQKSLLKLQLLPYAGKNVPHLVLEINQKCNISCESCYKQKFNYNKPVEVIKKEIEIGLKKRNLDKITIAGGEPTLHPDLVEIVRYINEKKINTRLLSNGLVLNLQMLENLRKAGLKEICLHIDSLQNRPDLEGAKSEKELNYLREKISKKIRASGIKSDFSIILYKENIGQLNDIVQWMLETDYETSLLVTISRDFKFIFSGFKRENILGIEYAGGENKPVETLPEELVNLDDVRKIFLTDFGMEPYACILGSKNKLSERWLLYRSLTIKRKNKPSIYLHFSADFNKVINLVYFLSKKIGKSYPFQRSNSSRQLVLLSLLYAILSFKLKTIFRVVIFLSALILPESKIYQKKFTFQQAPNPTKDGGIEYCDECPDATIRNGELMPLCMADYLSPLKYNKSNE